MCIIYKLWDGTNWTQYVSLFIITQLKWQLINSSIIGWKAIQFHRQLNIVWLVFIRIKKVAIMVLHCCESLRNLRYWRQLRLENVFWKTWTRPLILIRITINLTANMCDVKIHLWHDDTIAVKLQDWNNCSCSQKIWRLLSFHYIHTREYNMI
jgi:hypothetical protein